MPQYLLYKLARNPEYYKDEANIYTLMGNRKKALEVVENALKTSPENSSEEIRKFIESCLKNGNINDSDFNRLREIVKSTGSYEYTKQKIDEYNDLARSALARIDGNRDTVEMLDFLLEYLIKREN